MKSLGFGALFFASSLLVFAQDLPLNQACLKARSRAKEIQETYRALFAQVLDLDSDEAVINKENCQSLQAKALEVTSLDQLEISNLRPLAYFKNLEILTFYKEASLDDLSPLSSLTNLKVLRFNKAKLNKINLSSIAGLTKLEELDISGARIASSGADAPEIIPLGNMTQLKELDISDTHVTDLQPLANAKNLRTLVIEGLSLSNVKEEFKIFKALSILDVSRTNIDLQDLAAIPDIANGLEELWADEMQAPPVLEALKSFKKLVKLSLAKNKIKNILALGSLPNLETLYLEKNMIQDVSPLQNLKGLEFVLFVGDPVKNFSSLANLKKDHKSPKKDKTSKKDAMVHLRGF